MEWTREWTEAEFQENVELFGNRWGLTGDEIDALTMQDFHESLRQENLTMLRESIRANSDCSCGDPYCRTFHENIALEPYFERLQQRQGATMTDSTVAAAAATTANTAPPRPPAPPQPPRQELHISHQLDWTRNEWCRNGGQQQMKEWVLGQLRGEYPAWSCPFPVAIYINGEPTIVQGGYWEGRGRRDRQVFVGLYTPDVGTRYRQFEIATTLAIAGLFGLQTDEEIVTETERAIARMLSGIVTTITTGLINTRGSVSQIAMNGSQLAARIDGIWRASNGSVVDVTTEGWVTFDYRQ